MCVYMCKGRRDGETVRGEERDRETETEIVIEGMCLCYVMVTILLPLGTKYHKQHSFLILLSTTNI